MHKRRETKATILTMAGSLLVWGVQELIQGAHINGGLAVMVAGGLFWGYEYITQKENQKLINDTLEQVGEDRMKALIEEIGDQANERLADHRSSNDNDGR